MSIRPVTSVLQCVGMGVLACNLMALVYRISFDLPGIDVLGIIGPTMVGGIAGAAVRYYFMKVEEEAREDADFDRTPSQGNAETQAAIQYPGSTAQDLHMVAHEEDCTRAAETIVPDGTDAEPLSSLPEVEQEDMPKQMELWPWMSEPAVSADSCPVEITSKPVSMTWSESSATSGDPSAIEASFLKWMIKDASVFCFAINEQDEIVMANRRGAEYLGYSLEDLEGMAFTANLIPPWLRGNAWIGLLESTGKDEVSISMEGALISKEGREIPVQWSGEAIFDAHGELSHCFLTGIDISAHKQRERTRERDNLSSCAQVADEARKSAYYRSVLDSSIDPLVLFDMQGKATYVNPAFTTLFGWRAEDLNQEGSQFVPPAQRDLEKPLLEDLIERGIPCGSLDTKRQCKDGHLVSTRMTASLITSETGLPAGMLVILRALVQREKPDKQPAKPVPQPKKRQINAREIANDITKGATDAQLMEKYKLTARGLQSVFEKLVQAKVLTPSALVRRSPAYDETVAIELSRVLPLEKPKKQPRAHETDKTGLQVAARGTDAGTLRALGITEDGLDDLVKQLIPQQGRAPDTAVEESTAHTEGAEDVTARRVSARHYMVVSVPVYESNNLLNEGTILDLSEQGLKIEGIRTVKGETKSLLIQGDEFHDVYPFVFDAICRWATADKTTGKVVAGFQITAISETSAQELHKLIAALSISA